MLKPATAPNQDPYKRERPTNPAALDAADKQYKVNKLLLKRVYRNNRRPKYLVKWKGYGPKDDL